MFFTRKLSKSIHFLIDDLFVFREDSKCTKAYFRRAKAKASLGAYEEALYDLNQILLFDPSLESEINREKLILLKKSKDARLKQKNEFSNFFSRN